MLIGFIGGFFCFDFFVVGKNKGLDGENGIFICVYIDVIV